MSAELIYLADYLNDPSTHARSARSSIFPTEEVAAMCRLVDSVPVVDALNKWQAADEGDRQPGGRKAVLNHRALLVGMLLLQIEYSPFLTTELGNLFWRRLTPEARTMLGIDHVRISGDHRREAQLWYDRADRQRLRTFDLMDPAPAARRMMNTAERRYQVATRRSEEASTEKRRRLDWFVNQMIHATVLALPAEVRDTWAGDVSVDRTPIPAVSSRGRHQWKKRHGKRIGPEPESVVLDFDADWYHVKPEDRNTDDPRQDNKSIWAYAMNIAVATQSNPGTVPGHPLFAVAARMTAPNMDDLPEDTVWMLASLVERGYPQGRVTGDKEYYSVQAAERLALPTRALGYSPMMDYRSTELGAVGHIGGAIQVEGKLLCPSTPKGLVDASKLRLAGKIDDDTYAKRIAERAKYEVRRKEKPDENGAYPIVCPAYGAGATLDCPLRALHAKASKREVRPEVTPPPEHKLDRICRQTSVNVAPDKSTRYLQELRYGTEEWSARFGHDRSQIESFNSIIKDAAKEDIENTSRRRIRGFTGAYLAAAFAMVSANLRLTRAFYRAEAERRANPEKPYKRKTKPFTVITIENYKPTLPEMDLDGNITGVERRRPGRRQTQSPKTYPAAA